MSHLLLQSDPKIAFSKARKKLHHQEFIELQAFPGVKNIRLDATIKVTSPPEP